MTELQAKAAARRVQRKVSEWIGETGRLPCSVGQLVRDEALDEREEDMIFQALNQIYDCGYLVQAENQGWW
jgi:hypothetical protein